MNRRQRPTSRTCSARLLLERLEDRALLSFNPPDFYGVGRGPFYVEEGDFNHDGVLDLATSDHVGLSLSILLGIGDGTFQQAQTYGGVAIYPIWVEKGDVNSDGWMDLIMSDLNRMLVYLGNGDGTFQDPYGVPVPGETWVLEIADFNSDGFADVAAVERGGVLYVLLGNGDGSFLEPLRYAVGGRGRGITDKDFNGDGVIDLAVSSGAGIDVLLGNGDGSFQNAIRYSLPTGLGYVKSADFNGDGVADLAAARDSRRALYVLLGNGDGTFQAPAAFSTRWGPFGVDVADFNLDGALDVVTTNHESTGGTTTFSVLLGRGDGTFQDPLVYALDEGPISVTAEDFDDDGFPDLAIANDFSHTVAVLLNDGDWSGSGPGAPAAPSIPWAAWSPASTLWLDGSRHAVAVPVHGYRGTVTFWSSDPQAMLPAPYTFRPGDGGIASFPGGVTLRTPGTQYLIGEALQCWELPPGHFFGRAGFSLGSPPSML